MTVGEIQLANKYEISSGNKRKQCTIMTAAQRIILSDILYFDF